MGYRNFHMPGLHASQTELEGIYRVPQDILHVNSNFPPIFNVVEGGLDKIHDRLSQKGPLLVNKGSSPR